MILYYWVLFIGFFILALIVRYYRKVLHVMSEQSVGLVNELISSGDEDEKIDRIRRSTHRLLKSLLKTSGVFVLSLAAGALPFLFFLMFTGKEVQELDFTSFLSILVLSAGASLAFIIPSGKKRKSDYTELAQLLHRMSLNNYNLAWKLFTRERKKYRKRGMKIRKDFVIVSGLARAGTTSLMNNLAEVKDLVSLNYGNMPFLLSPNTWSRFYKPKSGQLKERSHKDGIMIGLNSNEALEEYFFKVKAKDSYIGSGLLSEYSISEEDYLDYLDYQGLVKRENEKIYLAKNNNFLLRYDSLRSYNDDFLMVILYRDPQTHAASLMEKHQEYSRLQEEDPFVLEYMNWLGHHEFGQNQKPFLFRDSEDLSESDKGSPDFWLKSWIRYYEKALQIHHPNTLFVNYDDYCRNPGETLSRILDKAGLKSDIPELKSFVNRRKISKPYSDHLLEQAQKIWMELKGRS